MPSIVVHRLRRAFSNPQVVILLGILLGSLLVLLLLGDALAPLIAGAIVAYLLEGAVTRLTHLGLPRAMAAALVTLLLLGILLVFFLVLIPLLLSQAAQIARLLPSLLASLQDFLLELPDEYPDLFDRQQVRAFIDRTGGDVIGAGQRLVMYSVAWLPTLITLMVYVVLLPMLVFFFLKDKDRIIAWMVAYLPRHRPLANRVWREVHAKMSSYIKGKVYEIIIVGVVSYLVFLALGLRFAALLAAGAGLSVLIPFFGAALAGVPVAIVAYAQWGAGDELAWTMVAYTIIQVLDGFLLSPLLLAGAVRLHPNAIIAATLIFGEIWGFWGLLFAVPLASLVQVVLGAWPRDWQWQAR